MTAPAIPPDAPLPAIHIIDREYDVIADLALRIETAQPALAARLMTELERAEVHDAAGLPEGVIRLNSHVEFVDEGSGAHRSVQLVMPGDADIAAGRVSILTPVGAGLIGMSQGSEILWPDREGHARLLRIVAVSQPV